jgi:outer membrane lipoprotein SlyB
MSALNWRFFPLGLFLVGLSGCGPSYSPDTYASNAVQQANKVEQGVVIGVRQVGVSAAGTVGTVAGAAAGGIAGAQAGVGPVSAITALGGSLVGGIAGSAAEHVSADTAAFEYIVRKPNGDLVSVTQKDKVPLALGQKVLVIAGNQARVVPDYTVPPDVSATKFDPGPGADKAAPPAKGAELVKPDAADIKPADARPVTTNPVTTDSEAGNAQPRTPSASPPTTPSAGDPQPALPDARSAPDSSSTGTGK